MWKYRCRIIGMFETCGVKERNETHCGFLVLLEEVNVCCFENEK